MNKIHFSKGPFDGSWLETNERIPEWIEFGMETIACDLQSPNTAEAITANITGTDLDEAVFMKDVAERSYRYVRDEDAEGDPEFVYDGWSVRGQSARQPAD